MIFLLEKPFLPSQSLPCAILLGEVGATSARLPDVVNRGGEMGGVRQFLSYTPPLIIPLFYCGSPSTIIWRIPAVCINPIYRVFGARARPHISIKLRKLVPLWYDIYSTGTVVFITQRFRIATSLAHGSPNVILRRPSTISGSMSVDGTALNTFISIAGRTRTIISGAFFRKAGRKTKDLIATRAAT